VEHRRLHHCIRGAGCRDGCGNAFVLMDRLVAVWQRTATRSAPSVT
jgi:hypothetical protein